MVSLQNISSSIRYATGAVKLNDSRRPELVATNFSSSVAGSSARKPRCPDTYQPPTMTAPMTTPPKIISRDERKSRLAKIQTRIAAATANGSHCRAPCSPTAAASPGRSDVAAPSAAKSKRTGSRPVARQTPKIPRSVMYAETPRNTSTTSDLTLPPPMRISVLLPQPDASVMPKPNRKPPSSIDSQFTLAPV